MESTAGSILQTPKPAIDNAGVSEAVTLAMRAFMQAHVRRSHMQQPYIICLGHTQDFPRVFAVGHQACRAVVW